MQLANAVTSTFSPASVSSLNSEIRRQNQDIAAGNAGVISAIKVQLAVLESRRGVLRQLDTQFHNAQNQR